MLKCLMLLSEDPVNSITKNNAEILTSLSTDIETNSSKIQEE